MSQCLVYMTTASDDEARKIGRTLVAERLAACVNIVPDMTSMYWWDGKVEEGAETVLLAKTRSDLVARLTDRVRTLHSYDCPCVVALEIRGGNPAFRAWIEDETADPVP